LAPTDLLDPRDRKDLPVFKDRKVWLVLRDLLGSLVLASRSWAPLPTPALSQTLLIKATHTLLHRPTLCGSTTALSGMMLV
jgi:hypothetical protein